MPFILFRYFFLMKTHIIRFFKFKNDNHVFNIQKHLITTPHTVYVENSFLSEI